MPSARVTLVRSISLSLEDKNETVRVQFCFVGLKRFASAIACRQVQSQAGKSLLLMATKYHSSE